MTIARLNKRNQLRTISSQRRRRLLVGLAVLMLASALVFTFWPRQPFIADVTGSPNLVLDQVKIDLGVLHWGTPATAVFRVRNTGDQPLMILNQPQVRVVTGCCPPQVDLGNRTIKPGQEITLSMTFVMHEGMDGPHDFRVLLQTNDPAHPEQELIVLSDWIQ